MTLLEQIQIAKNGKEINRCGDCDYLVFEDAKVSNSNGVAYCTYKKKRKLNWMNVRYEIDSGCELIKAKDEKDNK